MSNDIVMLIMQARGMPGTGITEIEKNQIQSDLSAIIGRPVIAEISDLEDVDLDGITDGQALLWDADASAFVPGTPSSGFNSSIRNDGGEWVTVVPSTTRVIADSQHGGLTADLAAPGAVFLRVLFAGTGTTSRAARSDHVHNNPLPVFEPFSASGYMSGGSRQVVSRSVTLAAGVPYAVIARFRPQLRGADPGAAYYTLTTTIAGNPKTSPGGATSGFWCVQGVPNNREWVHTREIVGTGTSITVTGSVAYHSGAGFNVDAGELEIELKPSR